MTFGEYVKHLRAQKGLSQRDLAEMSGVSNAEISRLETGERKKPSPKVIKAIAPCLGISYEELMIEAGYIDKVIDHDKYEEHVFEDDAGAFVDTYRKAKRIFERDEELLSMLDRALDKSSEQDINTIKKLLLGFVNGDLSDSEKAAIRTIIDSFSKQ